MKSIFLAAIVACAMQNNAVQAQVYDGQTFGNITMGSWGGIAVQHASDKRFRAYSMSGPWTIYIDFPASTCHPNLSVAYALPDASTQDVAPFIVSGVARVDSQDIYQIKFSIGASVGDTAFWFAAVPIDGFDNLAFQMRNGQVLRMKVSVGTSDYYPTFALNGFGTAYDTERQICLGGLAPAPNKQHASPKTERPPSGVKTL